MKVGDLIEWYDELKPGDIVLLLQVHTGRFGLKRVTSRDASEIPGPKYIVPANWGGQGLFFTVNGWEEYNAPIRRKPWWRFW